MTAVEDRENTEELTGGQGRREKTGNTMSSAELDIAAVAFAVVQPLSIM